MESHQINKARIKDIAEKAGVSIGTVDRVLHNRTGVKKDTYTRVTQIIESLGYTPNLLAKSLVSKKKLNIFIIVPDSSDDNPYWLKTAEGIKKTEQELLNYNVSITSYFFNASNEQSFTNAIKSFGDVHPDGVILDPIFREAALDYVSDLESKKVPYILIDVNLEGVNNLSYFGQDAWQSGKAAAQIMSFNLKTSSEILILKQAKNKSFSHHIESRIEGFKHFFESRLIPIKYTTLVIDLAQENEPDDSLKNLFREKTFDGIFVPNSRSFLLGNFFEKNSEKKCFTIGYDLLDQNKEHLKKGNIHCLINQRPEEQVYKATMALFNFLQNKKQVSRNQFAPIDIIVAENIDFIS